MKFVISREQITNLNLFIRVSHELKEMVSYCHDALRAINEIVFMQS
jgi:hypothetical protein